MSYGPKSDGDGGFVPRRVPIDYVTALPAAGDFLGHLFVLTTGAVGLYIWDGGSFVGPFGTGGGGGAPTTAQYVTLALDGTLSQERILTGGAAITVSDGGANGPVTVLVTDLGITTGKLANNAVTYSKMQDVSAASRLLGRGSAAGAGDPEEILLGTNLSMAGTTLNATGGGGSVPTGTGFRHVTGGVEDAAAKLVDTADVNNAQVTNAKLADMAQATVKGRQDGVGTGVPQDLTRTDLEDILHVDTLLDVNGIPKADGFGVKIEWLRPHSSMAMLVTNAAGAREWRGPLASNASVIPFVKGAGTDFVFPRVSISGSFPGSPEDGQFCWRPDLGDWFVFDTAAGGWLGSQTHLFHFSVLVDWSTTGYLVWDAGGSSPSFADRLGPIFGWQTKVVGISLAMDASGTCAVQVTGAGTAVGGSGDTLSLSSQIKKSQWPVYSSAITADTVLGVKLISGTIQGPAAGTVHVRRFLT